MSEMNLEPSKLSLAANQVWSESTSLFQKKTEVKIDLGLEKSGSIFNGGGESKGSTSTGIASGYVFGSRVADRVAKASENGGQKASGSVFARPVDVSSIFKRMAEKKKDGCSTADLWKNASACTTTAAGEDSKTSAETVAEGNETPASTSSEDRLKASADELAKHSSLGGDITSTAAEPVTTGEEDEKNVVNISCKFFYFNVESKSWVERGLGTLKINEKNNSCDNFRIVGRTTGSQKVVINSKIFPGMILRNTQLFLIQASPVSISRVQLLLERYISRAKAAEEKQKKCDDADVKSDATSRKRKPEQELDWNEDWE
uniref:RanBD1 domain-containing protein n=1 Tax=Ditylenchus dipsaci TaxID=166011 RepID=A0A915EKW3_9BILA